MFLLKKIFKLRDKSGGQNAEKPFLEHLEDLRDLIVRVVATLLVATILCYVFRGQLLDILRKPIEQVWQQSEEAKLPQTISPAVWEKAKQVADRTQALTPTQRSHFYSQFEDEKLQYYAECAQYYRAALLLENDEKRKQFINDFPELGEDQKETVLSLLEKSPSDTVNARNNVVFMSSLKPTETFMLAIKLSLFAGVIISFPLLLFFILQFVVPGLKENERKALYPALLVGFGLFLCGVCFCYFSVLPKALDFFFEYGKDMGVQNEWRIGEYISFATQFTLIFGLSFELPVVVMTLVKIGLLSYDTMRNTRSYAIISILVVAAIITPTGDALTLSMLGVPMIILYEICIWLAYFSRKKELAAEEEEREKIKAYTATLTDKDEEDEFEEDSVYEELDYNRETGYDDDNTEVDHDEEYDYDMDHPVPEPDPEFDAKHGFQTPRIVPVPGRVATNEEFDEEDYDDEGDEIDDGEVAEYDESEVYTEEDEINFDKKKAAEEEKKKLENNTDEKKNDDDSDSSEDNDDPIQKK